ncbi:hypothetical protein AB0M38_19765 [Streptomyces sp. NPDC051742]|uniref:hypothetical protein n=1 Tax=unclassified Streptomyces TaxID=2593676 RepID=UPI0034372137
MTTTLVPPPRTDGATPARAPSPLRTELRRGLGPWTGAAVAVTVLVTMYGKAPDWQGRWADATNMLHVVAGLLAGPLALAAGGWQGGRDRRRGTTDLWESVPRSPLRRLFVAVAPSALWPAAGLLLADAVCLLVTWPYVSAGRPYLELVAADAVAVAALGALGHVVGRVVRWRLTAPLVGIVGVRRPGLERLPGGPGALARSGRRAPVLLGPAGVVVRSRVDGMDGGDRARRAPRVRAAREPAAPARPRAAGRGRRRGGPDPAAAGGRGAVAP